MRTVETVASVIAGGTLTLQVPVDVPPGDHQVVLVIDERPIPPKKRPPLNFPVDSYGPWPKNLSLRREDMYDDDGR